MPESVTNQQSQHVRFCKKKQKTQNKTQENQRKSVQKERPLFGLFVLELQTTMLREPPCLATQRGGKRKIRKDTTRVANAGRSSAGPRLVPRDTFSGRTATSVRQEIDGHALARVAGARTHSSTYTIYVYINSWLLLVDLPLLRRPAWLRALNRLFNPYGI